MRKLDNFLAWGCFVLLLFPLLVAPWIFAGWEAWWLWRFMFFIFAAAFCFGIRMILCIKLGRRNLRFNNVTTTAAVAYMPFLIYVFLRSIQAPVYLDAERGFMLFFTPYLVAVIIAAGFSRIKMTWTAGLIVANFFALALYGLINHYVTGSTRVMWMPAYEQYHGRASGTYYCPDHFAGLMEFAIAAGAGLLLVRKTNWWMRVAGCVLALLAVAVIVLTKSRGAGMTVGVMLVALMVFGFRHHKPLVGNVLRAAGVIVLLAGVALLLFSDFAYAKRFRNYGWSNLQNSDRAVMIEGALRAWKTAPVWGIGPNMHRNVWLHFAASSDGDANAGRWPSKINNGFHSYEVHSDWTQLLEELGLVGLLLFLVPLIVVVWLLWCDWRIVKPEDDTYPGFIPNSIRPDHWLTLSGMLAIAGMGFHSLGDFNLQMPATTWILAAMIALPLGWYARGTRQSHSFPLKYQGMRCADDVV